MKKLILHLILFLLHSNSFADCPYTFSCTQQGCVKVTDTNCSLPVPQVSPQNLSNESDRVNSQGATFVSPTVKQNPSPNRYIPPASGCAENGSCYGDISSVNGTPKTTHVNGYYRSDGTYVRGHYRSRGR